MPAGSGQTAVIDTADWRLIVPMKCPLNLSGSRLTATMTGAFGGPAAAEIDSEDGSISWVADPITGVSTAVIVIVPKAMRGDWRATGANGQAAAVTVAFDIHRLVAGSPADEWLGRSWVLVLPASDSELVLAGAGTQPILIGKQPAGGVLLPALQTGPQGPGIAPPTFDNVADEGKTFGLKVVNGTLIWVAIDGSVAPSEPVDPAPKALAGRISAASALTGALTIVPPNALSGSVAGGASLTGGLTIIPPVVLSGGIAGAGSFTGALTKTASGTVALSGAIPGAGALTGALTVTAAGTTALAGAIAGSGGPTGALTVAAAGTSPLTGLISGSGGPTGSLTVVPAQPLTGAVSGAGGPTGALTVAAPTGLVQARKGRLAAAMAA